MGGEFCRTPRPVTTEGDTPSTRVTMIYSVSAQLKEIFELGKDYPWKLPATCPRCDHYRLWGHGFVGRYFDGFTSCLYLKCGRCPACGCVVTLRPDTHFRRIHTAISDIRAHLAERLGTGLWPRSDLPRSRLRHWLTNLSRQSCAVLTDSWQQGLLAAFDHLITRDVTPVSRFS